jgi:uncharacterized protein involved in outer membrane biogenesis
MRRVLLGSLIVVVAIGAVAAWLLSDANRYKPQIVDLIHDHTGLVVAIRGDLSWRLWPPVQLVAHDVVADWTADPQDPLLAAKTLRLDADIAPLLSREPKLVVQGIAIDGLHATLVETGEHANWTPPPHAGPAVAPIAAILAAADLATPWEVEDVTLRDSLVEYVDDDATTQVAIEALHLNGIGPGKAAPLHAKLTVKEPSREIPATIAAKVSFDTALARWQIADIDIGGVIHEPAQSFKFVGNAVIDTGAPTIDISNARLEFGPTVATFDAKADEKRVDFTNLELHYDGSIITGTVGSTLGDQRALAFDLHADRFVLPSTKAAVAIHIGAGTFSNIAFAAPTHDASLDQPLLPLDVIRATDWSGKVAVDQLVYEGAQFNDAKIETRNAAAEVDSTIELPQFFGGTANGHVTIDATGALPQWSVAPKLNHVDSQAFLGWLGNKYDWVAAFLAGGDFTMHGNTRHELLASLDGRATFDGGQGTINIEEIKTAAQGIANIAGGSKYVDAWPARLNYQRFVGNWEAKGVNQTFDVALDNLTLKANGRIDVLGDDMDLRATVTVNDDPKYKSFRVGSSLMGLPLPMRCKGSLATPKCGADEEGTRNLIAQALSGADPEMKHRLDKAIDEKVPEQYRDAARSLLEMLNKNKQQKPAQGQ